MSITSFDAVSGGSGMATGAGMIVEELGKLTLTTPGVEFIPGKIVMKQSTIAAISDDFQKVMLGDLCNTGGDNTGGDNWIVAAKSVVNMSARFPGEDRKYLDLALAPNPSNNDSCGLSISFLVERKNKDRFITAHNLKMRGNTLQIEDEMTVYDKVNVLGKGMSHIGVDVNAVDAPTVYSVSNLVRKFRLEDSGTTLKPTTARAQVPAEAQDGTLFLTIQTTSKKVGGPPQADRKTSMASVSSYSSTIVLASKTKSATKHKYMIEWFSSKKDELTASKAPIKLTDDNEPVALMAEPREGRSVFVMTRSAKTNAVSLYKLSKGRKLEQGEPIVTFDQQIDIAAMGLTSTDQVVLLAYTKGSETASLFTLSKSEGFRGKHPVCSQCVGLEALSSPAHVISCAISRWQLSPATVDPLVAAIPTAVVSLVTLLEPSGTYVLEPDTGYPYRLRIVGCDTQGFSPEAILMEDLERVFDSNATADGQSGEDKLSRATLKLCTNQAPCSDRLSQLSAWLMQGRIAAVEVNYVKSGMTSSLDLNSGSDRLVLRAMTAEKFRSYITDTDWTQQTGSGRQGTFTLDQSDSSKIPTANKSKVSRIPSATLPSITSPGGSGLPPRYQNSSSNLEDSAFSEFSPTDLSPRNARGVNGDSGDVSPAPLRASSANEKRLREIVRQLSESLTAVVEDNMALKNNLLVLQKSVEQLKLETACDNDE